MTDEALLLFDLDERHDLGTYAANALGEAVGRHEERRFSDGEMKVRPTERVRGRDVYVVQSLYGGPEFTVHDRLCRLILFLGAVRDAGAGRVTAAVPYLCYARKDRRTKPRDPLSLKYVAGMLGAVEVDRILTVEVHNLSAYENAFRSRVEHLEASPLFAGAIAERLEKGDRPVVLSPDPGGIKRADRFATVLSRELGGEIDTAFVEKHRSGGEVTGGRLVGPVEGGVAILYDDMISSGTTMHRALESAGEAGADRALAIATHGLFTEGSVENLDHPLLEEVLVTDTHPPFRIAGTPLADRVSVVEVAPLLAEAIRRLHEEGSMTDLSHPDLA